MRHQLIPKDVAVADESFGLLAGSSSQRRIPARERPGEHHLQRRHDLNDEVRHGNQATERVDILRARRVSDVDQNVVGGVDGAFVDEHGLAARPPGQRRMDAELSHDAAVRIQSGEAPVGVASDHRLRERQELEVLPGDDGLAQTSEVQGEVQEEAAGDDRPGDRYGQGSRDHSGRDCWSDGQRYCRNGN